MNDKWEEFETRWNADRNLVFTRGNTSDGEPIIDISAKEKHYLALIKDYVEQALSTQKQELEKKFEITEIALKSNCDQRLTMYKAELISEVEKMKYTEDQGMDAEMESANGALDQVINLLKGNEK